MSFLIDRRVEFLHIPKTAGMWIEHLCRGHIEVCGHRHDTRRYHPHLPSFAVARAPYPWLRSARAATQRTLDTLAGKNAKGWFPDNEFKKIGSMKSLRVKNVPMEDVLVEYLATMPGEYSRACIAYFKNATRLVDMMYLHESLSAVFNDFCEHASLFNRRMHEDKPINVSRRPVDVAPDRSGLLDKLIEAEQPYYNYVLRKGVAHD